MSAYDYSTVADIYDDFCVFDDDIAFFKEIAAANRGPVLELMAGTGRVSLPMLDVGSDLTCVDRSSAMLHVLARKLVAGGLKARLICADVCCLPLTSRFHTVVLPFQGFTELVSEDEQNGALSEVVRLLRPGGRFVCTSHNPAVRRATIDGRWHEIGKFSGRAGQTLVLRLKAAASDRRGVIEGSQIIDILDRDGKLIDTRVISMEFSLVAPEKILHMAGALGMKPISLFGDYRGSPYEADSSPCFVSVFEKSEQHHFTLGRSTGTLKSILSE